jgi:hypothetical protein
MIVYGLRNEKLGTEQTSSHVGAAFVPRTQTG